jgi:hypothetical protein
MVYIAFFADVKHKKGQTLSPIIYLGQGVQDLSWTRSPRFILDWGPY